MPVDHEPTDEPPDTERLPVDSSEVEGPPAERWPEEVSTAVEVPHPRGPGD
jgi:hypothetical protein